ncbi:unnamed protein product [Diatraea saccharalis]|uniref:Uncharacterized protein n=1 Tax=Diatraea saccharalis TaxID=40085 RepID=A0A9N9WHZ0_9NEOP|nr:unnamed protein product [Diatraea saccharalis]
MWRLVFLFAFYIKIVESNDLRVGYIQHNSREIFNEVREGSAALFWRRYEDVTINVPSNVLISAIYVTDLTDDKHGQASITNGGIGMNSVTINLRTTSLVRGYSFKVEVFADPPGYYNNGKANYYEPTPIYGRKY